LMLYDEAKRLKKLGYEDYDIARELQLPPKQIRYWLNDGVRPVTDRYDPNLTPSADLAYLIGFWIGDGRSAGKQKKVRFKLADREQLEHVNRLVARLLVRDPKRITTDASFYVVDYDSSVLYDYLAQPISALMPCVRAFRGDFLRGFFDAEGYVSIHADPVTRRLSAVVGVANTNPRYLRLVRDLLMKMGIEAGMRITNRKGGLMTIRGRTWVRRNDVCHVVIRRYQSIRQFFSLVGFNNAAKQTRLKDLIFLLGLVPDERFDWFVNHYRRMGRRWYRADPLQRV
jgi:intein-encoded DNA endonuclease-like protein